MKDPTKSDKKKKITVSNLFAFSHFVDSFKTVIAPREGSRRTILITLLVALFVVQNLIAGELDILYIFLANTGTASIFDYFFGFKNFLGAVALLVILPLAKWFGVQDYFLVLAGLVSFMSAMVVLGLSESIPMVFVSGLVGIGSKLVDSVLRALVSQVVDSEEVGKVFGIVAVNGDLAIIFGALLFNSVYTPLSHYMPGATYFMGSALLLIPLVLVIIANYLARNLTSGKESAESTNQVHYNHGYQQEEKLSS